MNSFKHLVRLVLLFCFTAVLANSGVSLPSKTESICINALRTGDMDLAVNLCQKQLTKTQDENDLKSTLSLHIALMDAYYQSENNDAFNYHSKQAANHPLFQASLPKQHKWLRLNAINLHLKGKLQQANELFSKALKIAIEINDESQIGHSNNDLGFSWAEQNNYKTALTHYKTSLKIFNQLNDLYHSGLSLHNIGRVQFELEKYDDAIKFYNDAMAEYEKQIKENDYDSRIHHNITNLYESLEEVYQVTNNFSEAKRYKSLIKDPPFKSKNNHDRIHQLEQSAKQMMDTEDYNNALVQLTEASKLYKIQDTKTPTSLHYSLAKTYQGLGHNELAIYYAEKGIKNNNINGPYDIATSQNLQLLSRLHEKSNPKLSLHFERKFNQSREQFLKIKYDGDLNTILHEIEIEKERNKLVTSQLQNTQQEVKIQKLNNKYLISLLILICLTVAIIYLYIKKKRQQSELFATINYHKNQLAVLSLATQPQETPHEDTQQIKIQQETVNEKLVDMMHEATNLWLEHTGENLIELSDRSKIWTITNDNGTLRARSLEKYLSLQKMPKNPRWRNVVRTCHFVLSETGLSNQQRKHLTHKLESLMKIIKDFYGTGK